MPSVGSPSRECVPADRDTWTTAEACAIYELPFNDLLFRAQSVHRSNFNPNQLQLSKLLSIKTGGCPEDCGYCSQSARAPTGLSASKLMDVDHVIEEARKAKEEKRRQTEEEDARKRTEEENRRRESARKREEEEHASRAARGLDVRVEAGPVARLADEDGRRPRAAAVSLRRPDRGPPADVPRAEEGGHRPRAASGPGTATTSGTPPARGPVPGPDR